MPSEPASTPGPARRPAGTADPWPVRPGTLAVVLVVLSLVTTSRVYLSLTLKGVADPFPVLFATEAMRWALWFPVVPLIVLLDSRMGYGRGSPVRATVLHAAFATLVLVVHTALTTLVGHQTDSYFILETPGETLLVQLVHEGATVVVVYAAVVALHHARLHLRERERRSTVQARLQARLAQERLRNLQMQLHPHFLFNALHAVGGLLRDGDRETAVETLSQLGELLRRSLRWRDRQEVTVEEEVDFAVSYLRIQQARYGPRLRVRVEMEPGTGDFLVPHLVLQPLVENAVGHGMDSMEGVGTIAIDVRMREGRLILDVLDDGPGIGSGVSSEGVGLATTRERLEAHYDGRASLTLEAGNGDGPSSGTRARIELPARRQVPADE